MCLHCCKVSYIIHGVILLYCVVITYSYNPFPNMYMEDDLSIQNIQGCFAF